MKTKAVGTPPTMVGRQGNLFNIEGTERNFTGRFNYRVSEKSVFHLTKF